MKIFEDNIKEHIELFSTLGSLSRDVSKAVTLIANSFNQNGKLLLCGNGGSAADCQHIAAEFTGRFITNRRPLPAISLATDTSALTCISNDFSYENVFERQLEALGQPGDCLLAISTSGKSQNVMNAVKRANAIGLTTIGLLGNDGGDIGGVCKVSIIVPSKVTARIQEAHILIGHTICGGVELQLNLS
jgi:D-sedoheptulose 7-phosphate isomerase